MLAKIMAALAKLRRVADQELGMIAAVRRMTVQTIFRDGRMVEHERPSLLSVTFVTKFVDCVCLDLMVAKGTVRIMAAGAFDQSLFNRMMRLSGCLRPDILMAFEAEGRLILFKQLFLLIVRCMTVITGNVFIAVFAHFPVCKLSCLVVAGQAFCGSFLGTDILVEGKDIHATASALFHMFGARTMTGFAGILCCGAFGRFL